MNEASPVNEASVAQKLKEILARVVSAGSKGRLDAGKIDGSAEFSTLGINSVDLMEFVLRIENEFRVDILSEMLPEDLPLTVNGWAKLVAARLARPSGP